MRLPILNDFWWRTIFAVLVVIGTLLIFTKCQAQDLFPIMRQNAILCRQEGDLLVVYDGGRPFMTYDPKTLTLVIFPPKHSAFKITRYLDRRNPSYPANTDDRVLWGNALEVQVGR